MSYENFEDLVGKYIQFDFTVRLRNGGDATKTYCGLVKLADPKCILILNIHEQWREWGFRINPSLIVSNIIEIDRMQFDLMYIISTGYFA
jgi:hypothetical protein